MNAELQIQIAKSRLVLTKHGDGSHDEKSHGNREGGGSSPKQKGDRIRIKQARTSGGHAWDVVVEEHVKGNKYKGRILSGPLAGQLVTGDLVLKGGEGSGHFGHAGRPGEVGGSADGDGEAQLSKDADAIAALSEDVRDNMELADFPGGAEAYNLYEARKMLPKPKETLKNVTDSNSFSLWQDYDAIANVSGVHFGVSKYEDPDEPDDDSKFVYAFRRLDHSIGMRETDTSDARELFGEMRKHIK